MASFFRNERTFITRPARNGIGSDCSRCSGGIYEKKTPATDWRHHRRVVATGAAAQNRDRNAYFGDLHVHTQYSFDAFIFNVRATPDDAYKFARGEAIDHPAGFKIQLQSGRSTSPR